MPLWESSEQPTAQSAYDLAEKHIHASQPDDHIAPTGDRDEYAVWTHSDGARPTRVATLTITTTDGSPVAPRQASGSRDPRIVGGRYRSHYWDREYEVLAISFTAHGVLKFITVRDDQGARTHATCWGERDEILFDPRIAPPTAAGPGALADRCPAYNVRSPHGIVVAVDERRAAVKWIDYRGLQHDTCVLPPALLCAGTLDAAARTRVIHCRRTDTAMPGLIQVVVPHNAEPTIEIRELRIFSSRSSETDTGLTFHTVRDANVALHALADAQEAFQSTFGPDPASAAPAPIPWSSTARSTPRFTVSSTAAPPVSAAPRLRPWLADAHSPPASPQRGRITDQRRLHRIAIPSSLAQYRPQRHRGSRLVRRPSPTISLRPPPVRIRAIRRMLSPWSPITT
jgi:hypothetical protein